jgi:hypothetical protein
MSRAISFTELLAAYPGLCRLIDVMVDCRVEFPCDVINSIMANCHEIALPDGNVAVPIKISDLIGGWDQRIQLSDRVRFVLANELMANTIFYRDLDENGQYPLSIFEEELDYCYCFLV